MLSVLYSLVSTSVMPADTAPVTHDCVQYITELYVSKIMLPESAYSGDPAFSDVKMNVGGEENIHAFSEPLPLASPWCTWPSIEDDTIAAKR